MNRLDTLKYIKNLPCEKTHNPLVTYLNDRSGGNPKEPGGREGC